MFLTWFNGREAAEIGAALADEFAARASDSGSIEQLLRRSDSKVRPLQFNFFKKAKFANSFKWRLIENGVARAIADEVTQSLVVHLSQSQIPSLTQNAADAAATRPDRARAQQLFNRGNKFFDQRAFAEATAVYEEAVELDSSHAEALNNLGSSLSYLGRYEEAEQYLRQSMAIKPNYANPYGNLGNLLRQKSSLAEAEIFLRRALKLKPNYTEARINLGMTLLSLGRLRDARACFAKALKAAPRNVHALVGMAQLDTLQGRFEEADTTLKRIVELDPKMPAAWAAMTLTRKMTNADGEWFKKAGGMATSGLLPLEEASLRFAMGKYCDDLNDFEQAFANYKRGNELMKTAAEDYDRNEYSHLVDELIRVYSGEAISKIGTAGSSSTKPVFVVGMPRSGTSLAEQIIAAHPAAYGAGELGFWAAIIAKNASPTLSILGEPTRPKVAEEYLRILQGRSANASRVVDKAPVNSDFLGLIHAVFPHARVIYMQRDPIDTCLSCYFQQFLTGLNFTLDLSDLAHHYREHQRIMAHWRAVLPPGFILDVPYEELVSDQEGWSRKMLEFIGLEWDPRCLDFHTNKRQVATASAWQVRQKIYLTSVARWRNYEKFIGPLKSLKR
jgi:tetratricopeptide (TPR) repeat protein